MQAGQLFIRHAQFAQGRKSFADIFPRAKNTYVTRRRRERNFQCRVVQLFIVTDHHNVSTLVGMQFLQRIGRPFGDEFICVRKTLARGKGLAWINHNRAIAESLRKRYQRHGDMHRADDDQTGRGRQDIREHL